MKNTASRWQKIGLVGACFILGGLCWSVFSNVGGLSQAIPPDEADFVDINIPKSHFSPAEVVALQVQSIRDSLTNPERLKVCYSLASPENRAVTGPFARFAQMVMLPSYDRLANSQEWQIGSATIEGDYAAVLVSTVSNDGDATAFRFLMHQHQKAPYKGCWLTEAVQVLNQVRSPEEIKRLDPKEPLLD
jgi:hypothetical protein